MLAFNVKLGYSAAMETAIKRAWTHSTSQEVVSEEDA
jgi:hypothetical protein